jgi:hypothetical protein
MVPQLLTSSITQMVYRIGQSGMVQPMYDNYLPNTLEQIDYSQLHLMMK